MENIYDGALHDITDKISDAHITVNSSGFNNDEILTVVRENGRKDYHIIYVVSGQLEAELDGNKYVLGENDFVLYCPGQKQWYSAKKPCSRFWIHFTGTQVQKTLDEYGFAQGVYRGIEIQEIRNIFRELADEYLMPREKSDLKSMALLQMLLLRLYESINSEKYVNPAVSALVKQINADCRVEIDTKEFARIAGVSEESFAYLFKNYMGTPIHKYITQVRLKQALRLLKYSSGSVSEIAYSVGYNDPLYFSRIFKKYYGVPPKYIRKS